MIKFKEENTEIIYEYSDWDGIHPCNRFFHIFDLELLPRSCPKCVKYNFRWSYDLRGQTNSVACICCNEVLWRYI